MPWGDTALVTESVKRKEKVVKAQRSALEEANFSVDPKEILAKKPEQKLNWAVKAVELARRHTVKVNLVFDIISNPRFILSFGPGRGAQFRAVIERNLDLFSTKQQKFLQSSECKLTTFQGGDDSEDGEDPDPKAISGGRTVEVIEPFEVYNQGEDKMKLKKGMYGVVARTDKDGDALVDFYREGQSGQTFAMWVFKRDFSKLDAKVKITSTSEIKINFKTTLSKSGEAQLPQFKARKLPAEDKDDRGEHDDDIHSPVDGNTDAIDVKTGDPHEATPTEPSDPSGAPGAVKRKEKLSGLFQPDEKLRTLLEMGKQSVQQAKVDILSASTTHAPIKLTFKAAQPKPLLGLAGKDSRVAANSTRTGPESDPVSIAVAAAERAASVANTAQPVRAADYRDLTPPRGAVQLEPRRSERSGGSDRTERSRSRSNSHEAGRALLRRIIKRDSRSRSRRQNGSRNGGRGHSRSENVSLDRDSRDCIYIWLQAGIDYVKDRGRYDKQGRPEAGDKLRTTPPPKILSFMLREGHCEEEGESEEDLRDEGAVLS